MALQKLQLWLFTLLLAWASRGEAAFMLREAMPGIALGKYLSHWEDKNGVTQFESIEALKRQGEFKVSQQDVPNFGLNRYTQWFILPIENPFPEPQTILLENKFSFCDELTLWFQSDTGQWLKKSAGDQVDVSTRDVATRQIVFRVTLPPGKSQLVFRSRVDGAHQLALYAWTPEDFYEHNSFEYLWIGLLVGFHVLISIYNLFLYFSFRDRTYLYYIAYVLTNLLYQTGSLGLLLQSLHILNLRHTLPNELTIISVDLVGLTALLFSYRFLNIKKTLPFLAPAYYGAALIHTLNFCITLLFSNWWGTVFCFATASMATTLLILSGLLLSLQGSRPAQFYLAAWGFYLSGVTGTLSNLLGMAPSNEISRWGQFLGGAIEMSMISLALGARINEREQAIIRQITAAYQKADKLSQEVIEKEKARTVFFQNTSHELRTPLNGIIGFLSLINQDHFGPLPESVKTPLTKALKLAESLKNQVNTILDLAKLKKGEARFNPKLFSIDRLKQDLDTLAEGLRLSLTYSSYQSRVRLEGKTLFVGDYDHIYTILRNLIGNAFKFRDGSRPHLVEVEIQRGANSLILVVQDNGIGIAPADQKRIFDEFTQVQTDARRSYEGTGLGLNLVKSLVQLMGGTIELSSQVGEGSRFTVRIPESEEKAETTLTESPSLLLVQPEATQESSAQSQPQVIPKSVRHEYIVIIDDNQTNCEVILGHLSLDGYRLHYFLEGSKALEAMRQKRPAMVLLDLMMPVMSGEDVLKAMRADATLSDIPVILITARASEEDRIDGLRLGADDYLSKPILGPELRLRVRNILERTRLQQELERRFYDAKLQQMGAMFADLSHELKNILNGIAGLSQLNKLDGLLSTAVLPLEDTQRESYADALIRPAVTVGIESRLSLMKDGEDAKRSLKSKPISFLLAEIDLAQEELLALWQAFARFDEEEFAYAGSQLKLFSQYKSLLRMTQHTFDLTMAVLSFTRRDASVRRSELNDVWSKVLLLCRSRLKLQSIDWQVELSEDILPISPEALLQVLVNLIFNAAEAIQPLGPEYQWIRVESFKDQFTLGLRIENGGLPISPDVQARLFERGFSTKGSSGNGIGLYLAQRLVEESKGQLLYDETADHPRFTITWTLPSETI